MTRFTKKEKLRKERRIQQKANILKKQERQAEELENEDLTAETDDEELLSSELEEEAAETEIPEDENPKGEETHKDLNFPPAYPEEVGAGPTSFQELDQMRVAVEQTESLNALTWDVRDVVNNILRDSEMDMQEKADAIKEVGTDFSQRSDEIMAAASLSAVNDIEDDEEVEEQAELEEEADEKDLDLLAFKALGAYDRRHTTLWDMLKAKVSYGSRKNMPDSNFAVVTSKTGTSGKKIKIRKYLIHDAVHVRNALARIPQAIAVGGDSAKYARMAMPKVHAAAKKMGIGQTKKERSAIMVEKDATGKWRWVGWESNNFIDWDGDIISKAAHEEYIEWWQKNKDLYPAFVSWHTPGTQRTHPVDFMTFDQGFMIMSGPLEEQEAAVLLKAKIDTDLGMSHGTFVLGRDPKDPRVITKYRTYEVSDLPLENAANPFTDFETITKEVGMDKTKYLATILGSEEKAKKFMERTGMKQKELQEAGIESKEKTEPTSAPAATAPAQTSKELIEQVMKEMDIEGLNEFVTKAQEAIDKVPMLEEVIKTLQTSQNEKLAEILTPPAERRFAWTKARTSQSDETVIEKSAKLAAEQPGVPADYWLSQATGTTPLKEEPVKGKSMADLMAQ